MQNAGKGLELRLDKFLSDMNLASRSEIKKAIRGRRVMVNGVLVDKPEFKIEPADNSEVSYCGKRVIYQEKQYYMLNKPSGVVSATEDKHFTTVLELIKEQHRRDLFPVGRLDKDTEGLLLITNDGMLAHNLLSPGRHVDKSYFVRISGEAGIQDIMRFSEGIAYDEDLTALPAKMEILSASPDSSELLVTIQEGKFHQIKKMIAALGDGKEVLYLKRLSMGGLKLDKALLPGEYRQLTEEELSILGCGSKTTKG